MSDAFEASIAEMTLYLKQVENGVILIVVCDDLVLRDTARHALTEAVKRDIELQDFYLTPTRLSMLEAVEASPTLATTHQNVTLSAWGLESLSPDVRTEALRLLNLQRNRFGRTHASVVLWVTTPILAELAELAPDFYSWRSRTFFLDPPPGWDIRHSARETYLRTLVQQNEFVNMQGMAPKHGGQVVQVRIANIFIRLKAEEESIFDGSLTVPFERAESGQATAIEFLAAELLRLQHHREITSKPVDISDLLNRLRVVVLGDPGAGKTTLLRYIAYSLAHDQMCENGHTTVPWRSDQLTLLPIYIRIGEYAQYLRQHPDTTIEAFLPMGLQRQHLSLSRELLENALTYGQVLFLLDGMDEIMDTGQRREVAGRIEELAAAHSTCPIVATSRIVGYREAALRSDFAQFTISPLEDADIKQFAHNWYRALAGVDNQDVGSEDTSSHQIQAEHLIEAIQANASVKRLATNPLLLTVIALIYWRGTRLPQHRVTLYREAAETLVDQWPTYRGWISASRGTAEARRVEPEGWHPREVQQVLLPAIAGEIHHSTSTGLIGEEDLRHLVGLTLRQHHPRMSEDEAQTKATQFLRNVSEFSGIFLERGIDEQDLRIYGFLHPTFEEYFAARRLADELGRRGDAVIKPLLHSARWNEVILLCAGHFGEWDQPQATRFVRAILEADSEYEDILHRDLFLAASCLADDVNVDADLREQIITLLLTLYFSDLEPGTLYSDIRTIFARFSGTPIVVELSIDLTERLKASETRIRALAAFTLVYLGQVTATPEFLSALLDMLCDSDITVQVLAMSAMSRFGPVAATSEVLSALLDMLRDSDGTSSDGTSMVIAAYTLGEFGSAAATPTILSALLDMLRDSDASVSVSAAATLSSLGSAAAIPEVLSVLLDMLRDSETLLPVMVLSVIRSFGSAAATPEVLSALLDMLRDSETHSPGVAESVLRNLGEAAATPEILAVLMDLLNHSDASVAASAAVTLGRLGVATTTPEVLSVLMDTLHAWNAFNTDLVIDVLKSLGKAAGSPEALTVLTDMLYASDASIRTSAADVLGDLGSVAATPEVMAALLKILCDSDASNRALAVETLGRLGQAATTSECLALLFACIDRSVEAIPQQSQDDYLAAAEALLRFVSYIPSSYKPQAITSFIKMSKSRDIRIRNAGYKGLRNLMAADHQ